jgi:ATP-dependent DNA helicase RecQ
METFEEHEAREIDRIDRMIEYAARQECLTAGLLEYFGEEIGECGHCAVCLDHRGAVLPERSTTSLRGVDLGGFGALVADHPSALARPRQQARFLCGLNSPAVSASRDLRGNPLFGCCADVPFAQVLAER